jgi:hypothetical protein
MSGDLESSPSDVLHVEARFADTEATIILDGVRALPSQPGTSPPKNAPSAVIGMSS